MKKINTCGMSCPQPVLMTKKALATEPDVLEIVVDNDTAKENVLRFIDQAGYACDSQVSPEGYLLKVKK